MHVLHLHAVQIALHVKNLAWRAQVRSVLDEANPGAGNAGGSLVFSTAAQGGATLVDRLVISQSGAASFQGPISGASTATFADLLTASSGLSIPSGALSAGGSLAVAGAITGSSTAAFAGLVTAGNGLAVTGLLAAGGAATVNGTSLFTFKFIGDCLILSYSVSRLLHVNARLAAS